MAALTTEAMEMRLALKPAIGMRATSIMMVALCRDE